MDKRGLFPEVKGSYGFIDESQDVFTCFPYRFSYGADSLDKPLSPNASSSITLFSPKNKSSQVSFSKIIGRSHQLQSLRIVVSK
jgi:hypothetical protein